MVGEIFVNETPDKVLTFLDTKKVDMKAKGQGFDKNKEGSNVRSQDSLLC